MAGLMDLLNSPDANLALSLLSSAGPSPVPMPFGATVGRAALQAQQNYQDFMTKQLALQQAQSNFGVTQAMNDAYARALQQQGQQPGGPSVPQQSQGIPQQGAFLPGNSAMPPSQSASQSSAPQQPDQNASWLTPPTLEQIRSIPVGGMPANLSVIAKARANGGDFAAGMKEVEGMQFGQAQRQLAPKIATLDNLIKSDKPSIYMRADQSLVSAWPQLATQAGIDPKDYNDDNVRRALTFARNGLASSVNLPTVAPTNRLVTRGIQQVDPVTGKIEHEEKLQSVIGPDGKPVLVPESQAVGMTPFNPSIFGAANMSDQAIQFAADTYRTTGKMPPAFARNPMAQAKVLDRVAQDASASGDTAGSIAARSASLKANGQALDQITKLESNTMSAADTLDRNIKSLKEYAGKVDSSGVPLLNKAYRYWQQGVQGSPDVAKLVTMMNAVEGEYAKISSGNFSSGGVTEGAKRDAKDVINKFMNNGQIDAVAEAMTQEKENRLAAIRQQKETLQGQLSASAPKSGPQSTQATNQPAMTNAKGWALHVDKNGNKAYVSPDGKQFEEVK